MLNLVLVKQNDKESNNDWLIDHSSILHCRNRFHYGKSQNLANLKQKVATKLAFIDFWPECGKTLRLLKSRNVNLTDIEVKWLKKKKKSVESNYFYKKKEKSPS